MGHCSWCLPQCFSTKYWLDYYSNCREKKTGVSLSDLPDEILESIFSYLTLPDRKNARLVCQRWRDVSFSAGLLMNDVTTIKDTQFLMQSENFHKAVNITLTGNVSSFSTNIEYWMKSGHVVGRLDLLNFPLYDPAFQEIFLHLPNLTSLTIQRFNIEERTEKTPISISLPSLVRFELTGYYEASRKTMSDVMRVLESAPNLKIVIFTLFRCQFKGVFANFLKRKQTLKKFELFNIDYGDVLEEIVDSLPKKLEFIGLPHCSVLDNDILDDMADKFQNLHQVDVSYVHCDDEVLSQLLSLLQFQLTHLNLSNTKIQPHSLIKIAWMPKLRALDLTGCDALTPDTLHLTFAVHPLKNLVDLRLGSHHFFIGDKIKEMFRNLSNLKYLSIKYRSLTDLVLRAITEECTNLRYLAILGLDEQSTGYLLNDLVNLKQLNLSNCSLIASFSFLSLSLPRLESLFIFRTGIRTCFLENAARRCPLLRNIYLETHALDKGGEKFWAKSMCNLNFITGVIAERTIFDEEINMFHFEH